MNLKIFLTCSFYQDKMHTIISFRFSLFKKLFWTNLNLPCSVVLMFQTKTPRKSLVCTEKSCAKAHILRPRISNSLGTGGAAYWNNSGKNFTLLSDSVPKEQAHSTAKFAYKNLWHQQHFTSTLSLSLSQTVWKTSQLYWK